jgi:ligand-binding sensor domain-containing protein
MKKYLLKTQNFALLILLIFTTCCNGQVKTDLPKGSNESKVKPIGQLKLITNHSDPHYQKLSGNVHCGLLDKGGNLWFGTTGDGVYRYDGKFFINFTTKDGLNDNCVYSILEDKAGNIWFGTEAGICRYNGTTITNIPITTTNNINLYSSISSNNSPTKRNGVSSMLQDKSGTIWFGTADGVYCYNGKSFTRFLENDSIINKNDLKLKSVACMLEDKNGDIWFGSGMLPNGGEGVCRYDGKSITSFKPNGDNWICFMLEDKDGYIWFSGRKNGNFRYDGKTFANFPEKVGAGLVFEVKAGVGPIFEDKTGNIWFTGEEDNGSGGDGGIWRHDGKSFINFTPKDGLGDYAVWCMIEDKTGNIWIGTNNSGLYRFDGKTFASFSE